MNVVGLSAVLEGQLRSASFRDPTPAKKGERSREREGPAFRVENEKRLALMREDRAAVHSTWFSRGGARPKAELELEPSQGQPDLRWTAVQ